MDSLTIYTILAFIGVGSLFVVMIGSMLGLEVLETENPYLLKIFTSAIAGVGLGGLKWGLEGAILLGFGFASLMGIVIYAVMNLKKESGIDLNTVKGSVGTVSISMNTKNTGKIMVPIGGSMRESDAMSNEPLKIGDKVVVEDVVGSVFVVRKVISSERVSDL